MAGLLRTACLASTAAIVLAVATTAALAAGDAAKGATAFKGKCATCHTVDKGAPNGALGPNLFGAVGRKAASLASFKYSAALSTSGITWSDDNLKGWVMNPQKVVPGTKMVLIHAPSSEDADDIIAFLDTKK